MNGNKLLSCHMAVLTRVSECSSHMQFRCFLFYDAFHYNLLCYLEVIVSSQL